MRIAEHALYGIARLLYGTDGAQTEAMKRGIADLDSYDLMRGEEANKMLKALARYDVSIAGKVVADFGCGGGGLSAACFSAGASRVIGLDVNEISVTRARARYSSEMLTFLVSGRDSIPLETESIDVLVSFDVFEHVAEPVTILREIFRILRPGADVVIATMGWNMPYASHLWAVMPVPWAHVLASERTVLRACQRVSDSPWYRPQRYDFDSRGQRIPNRYAEDVIPRSYLNHYRVIDFERSFAAAGFQYRTDIIPIRGIRVLTPFCHLPWVREFVGSSVWFALRKPRVSSSR